jgi:hypothetical protein
MKKILFLLFFSLHITFLSAQNLYLEDFKSLLPSLKAEDWETVFKQSSKMLKSAPKDTSDIKAIITYANIIAAAGMVAEDKMTYKKLDKVVAKFKGQRILSSSKTVEGNNFQMTDSTKTAFHIYTNLSATNILCFVHFNFNQQIDTAAFGSAMVRCGGIIDSIESNPNKSKIWILRIRLKNSIARKTS